jgi:2'-5' RNA ligase
MSRKTKRLFWAAKPRLPETILKVRDDFMRALIAEQLKWVPPENLHFTLKFLGDTSLGQLEQLVKIGNEAARQLSAFDLKVNGFGAFYKQKVPKVIFFKAQENEKLHKIAGYLDTACAELGFEPENRPFKAHLTLARVRHLRKSSGFERLLKASAEANLHIDRLYLFESKLKPGGSEHNALSEFLLC